MIYLRVGSENYLETIGQNGTTEPLFIGDDPQKILNQAIREIGKMQNQKGMNISPSRYLENMIWKYFVMCAIVFDSWCAVFVYDFRHVYQRILLF